jgi:hypothetical protein
MEQTQVIKQIVDFQKNVFENSYGAMETARTRTENMVNSMMDNAFWIPEPVKTACNDWNRTINEGCQSFKKMVDDNFDKMESFFVKDK